MSAALSVIYAERDNLVACLFASRIKEWAEVSEFTFATSVEETVRRCKANPPDLVILGFRLSRTERAALVDAVHRATRRTRLLLLIERITVFDAMTLMKQRIAAVVSTATSNPDILREALRFVADGRLFVSPDVQSQLTAIRQAPDALHKILSDREFELLPMFGSGLDDNEIGGSLRLSPLTVKRHRARVLMKLGLHSTPALMRWAAQQGCDFGEP